MFIGIRFTTKHVYSSSNVIIYVSNSYLKTKLLGPEKLHYHCQIQYWDRSRGAPLTCMDTSGGRSILAETAGFTLCFEEGQNVILADGALDVANDGAVAGIVEKLNTNLGDATARASTAENPDNFGVDNVGLLACK